jgi:hypothetical protein
MRRRGLVYALLHLVGEALGHPEIGGNAVEVIRGLVSQA